MVSILIRAFFGEKFLRESDDFARKRETWIFPGENEGMKLKFQELWSFLGMPLKNSERYSWCSGGLLFTHGSAQTAFGIAVAPSTVFLIGPLQDPVTWYGINYSGTQMTQRDFQNKGKSRWIDHLQDPVTWYGINYTGTQMTQWDFQNKGKSGWTGKSSFVLKVPLRHLRPSVIYSVPCDWILQMAYW